MRFVPVFPTPLLLAATAVAACVLPVRAAEFQGGHMFVSSAGDHRVYEFDGDGALVRTIGAGSGLAAPRGLAFGPDGNLYVGSFTGNQVFVFDGDGGLVRTVGSATALGGVELIAFGGRGRLHVCSASTQTVAVYDFAGAKVQDLTTTQALNPFDVAIGPDGHVFISSGVVLTELDASGVEVGFRLLDIFSSNDYTGLAWGPRGALYAAEDDNGDHEVHLYGDALTSLGSTARDLGDLSGPRGIAFGPNGNLFVVDGGVVKEFDPAPQGDKLADHAVGAGLSNPYDVAFAPYAFAATISGTLAVPGAAAKKVKEKKARLQVFPGGLELSLLFVDDPTDADDVASVFGDDPIVLRGYEAAASPQASARVVIATEVPASTQQDGITSLQLDLKGTKAKKGGVTASLLSATGTLHRASPAGVFSGKVSAKKTLK